MSDGSVDCWGEGDATPYPSPGWSGISTVSIGGSHRCAVTSGNAVTCLGDDNFGQLGDGVTTGALPQAVVEP
jgi:hypothetical protein